MNQILVDFESNFHLFFTGCRIFAVTPGTKLVSKHVKYSTTQATGLSVGCYRVKEPDKNTERILIIRDEDKGGENPVVVTELESDKREVNVGGKNLEKSKKAKNKSKKAKSSEDETDEEDFSSDDSDDPSWGSKKRKTRNDARGKKRKRNKY